MRIKEKTAPFPILKLASWGAKKAGDLHFHGGGTNLTGSLSTKLIFIDVVTVAGHVQSLILECNLGTFCDWEGVLLTEQIWGSHIAHLTSPPRPMNVLWGQLNTCANLANGLPFQFRKQFVNLLYIKRL